VETPSDLLPLAAAGFALGWNVAWAPGPINVEILRRGVRRGFGPAFLVGAGASSGDFLWALGVTAGLGAAARGPRTQAVLGVASVVLLAVLGAVFLRGAWKARDAARDPPAAAPDVPSRLDSGRGGFLLGFGMALTSPWNVAFWTAVLGRQAALDTGPGRAVLLALFVVAGALAWCLTLCLAVRWGARFASPAWEIGTRAVTGLVMLGYAGWTAWALAGV